MKPLRRKRQYEVTQDPVSGQERILESSNEEHALGDAGSVDSLAKRNRYPNDCGCFKPVGGRCIQCGKLSCVDCHGHCNGCGKPLCLECSISIDLPDKQRIRLCGRCCLKLKRRERLSKAKRFLLSAFLEFEGNHDGKK